MLARLLMANDIDGTAPFEIIKLEGEKEWLAQQFSRRVKGLIQQFPADSTVSLVMEIQHES